MNVANYISKKEQKMLLIVAFCAFIFAFSSFVYDSAETYNQKIREKQEELLRKANYDPNKASFCVYGDWGDDRPLFRFSIVFLTLFIVLTLRKANKYLFSAIFTTLVFCIFIKWFVAMIHALSTNETIPDHLTERFFLVANFFDYIDFLFVTILLCWQIPILSRIFNKSRQQQYPLP